MGIHVVTRRFLVAAALAAVTGCSLDKQAAPPLAGPSELGLSLAISATPDHIQQDGQSRSTVEVFARDANNQPKAGVALHIQQTVDGKGVDVGTLSAKFVSTDNNGKAVVFYTAPATPSPFQTDDLRVSIGVTPVGTDFNGAAARYVDLRLVHPGVIQPPGDAPKASFYFSPTAPRSEDDVFFDGSASTPSARLVNYLWDFGDGRTGSGKTARHHYEVPAAYTVKLTVVDDLGRQSTETKTVTIAALANPVAGFNFSPTAPKSGQVVNFDALPSTAEVGHRIVSYTWDFGDNGQLFTTDQPTTQRIYPVGNFTVTLMVTDDVGRKGTTVKTIGVTAP
jgi:PKD repeat protein